MNFVSDRVKAETANIEDKKEMNELPKPSVLFIGPEKLEIIELFPKIVNSVKAFYLKSEGDYHVELYTTSGVVQYQGEFLIR